jgi:hypothetical protein
MKDNFFICVETYHFADRGTSDNLHELPPEKLKQREVVHIDIANDPVSRSDYKQGKYSTRRTAFLWVSDPLCLSSSSAHHFCPIILFGSTTLLTGVTGNSLHMQWPLTSQ